jgi:hypothetical protein
LFRVCIVVTISLYSVFCEIPEILKLHSDDAEVLGRVKILLETARAAGMDASFGALFHSDQIPAQNKTFSGEWQIC